MWIAARRRTWEWPPPLDDDDGGGGGGRARGGDDDVEEFSASKTFCGYRRGMVFKLGDQGQGYYKDAPLAGNTEREFAGQLSFYPSRTFIGHRRGMVYRKGDRGMGYYTDDPFGGVPIGGQVARIVRNA